jgi:small-conductance mechanosensitive channel
MRLAGIDIDAPAALVIPLFLLGLLVLSGVVVRLIRLATKRWLGKPSGPDGSERTPPPKVAVPVGVAVLVGGLLLVLPELPLPGRLGHWVVDALIVVFVFACALPVSRIAIAAISEYGARHPSFTPALGVARGTVRVAVAVLAAITALESLGVPVAPLLATLGVGSLAVALALQDTLANFFAGLYLLADRPVGAGDYIKIHDGEEGYVEAIGWRSSRLRTMKGSVVIVPNQKLSQAILTNFHRPTSAVVMTIAITVGTDTDIAAVEALFLDEMGRATKELPELANAKPLARLVDATDSGLVWNCIVEVPSFEAQGIAGHELRKRLYGRLRREGIALGVPGRLLLKENDRAAEGNPDRDRPPLGKTAIETEK